ncbi:MAG: ATP synthase subunit I [Pyrinomonadaceae bacterium]
MSHRRILWLMMLVTLFAAAAGSVFSSLIFGFGIITGGVLSFVNYYWLKFSLKKIFDGAAEGRKPGLFGAQYILRFMAFGLLLAIIYLTNVLPMTAVLLGLASFAFAVVIEGILRIFGSFSNKREI